MMNKRLIKIGRLLMVTTIIFLSLTITSGALEEESSTEETPYLVMEKVTDFFSGDNLDILQDTKERIKELTDSIGRGAEKVGESIDKLADFLGFDNTDSEEEIEQQESVSTGKINGTVKTEDGEALENIRVNVGNYATYTNSTGDFVFDNLPYGVYTLSYQASQGEALKNIEEIVIDSDNDRYVVSLVLDTGISGEVLDEEESAREIVVDSSTEVAPEDTEMENQDEDDRNLGFIIILILVLLPLLLFVVINRKHIKIIDGKTGETLGKKKIDIKPVTWIDLTEEFQEASDGKIRVQFLSSAIQKLYGKKVVFTVDDIIIGDIPEYTGELDFSVRRKLVEEGTQEPEEQKR